MPIAQLSQEVKRVFDVDLKGFMVNVNGEYKGNLVRSRSIRDREERKTYRMFVKNSDLELWTHGTRAVWEESNRRSKLDIEPNAKPSDEVFPPFADEEKEGIPDYR